MHEYLKQISKALAYDYLEEKIHIKFINKKDFE